MTLHRPDPTPVRNYGPLLFATSFLANWFLLLVVGIERISPLFMADWVLAVLCFIAPVTTLIALVYNRRKCGYTFTQGDDTDD